MKRINTLLLDADGTLFDFESAEKAAFEKMCVRENLPFTPQLHQSYKVINIACWEQLERGELDKDTLMWRRFELYAEANGLKLDALRCSDIYMDELMLRPDMLPGAEEVLALLQAQGFRLYLITNGVQATQESRYALSPLPKYISEMFVSEAIGYPKPDVRYFDYVFTHIPDFDPKRTLLVGDSLTSDIQGGINTGLATCWLNPAHKAAPENRRPDYQISDITELPELIRMLNQSEDSLC